MVVVDPTLGALGLRMHKSRVESLYGKAERIENAKVILGEKNEVYKGLLPINNISLKLQEIRERLLKESRYLLWVRNFTEIPGEMWKGPLNLAEKSHRLLRKVKWSIEKGVKVLIYDEEIFGTVGER